MSNWFYYDSLHDSQPVDSSGNVCTDPAKVTGYVRTTKPVHRPGKPMVKAAKKKRGRR